MIDDTVAMMEAAVAASPGDDTARLVLADALRDAGKSELAVKRRINRIARQEAAAKLLVEMTELVAADTGKGRRVRSAIRRVAGCGRSHAPITVVDGDAAPAMTGRPAYHTFRGKKGRDGGVCMYPGAAMRKGYDVDYHPSTLAVTVGAGWVAAYRG